MHLKRQKAPRHWPITRKGTKYVVLPTHNLRKGIPLVLLLRDILHIAENRREVKKAVKNGLVLLNNKKIKNEKISTLLFDVITLVPSKKNYRIVLTEKGKFDLIEISEKEAIGKIAKIESKKMLKRGKIQINLSDGRNFIFDGKCKVNDSVFVRFAEGQEKEKAEKVLHLRENVNAVVIGGKHEGKKGKITKIDEGRGTAIISEGSKNREILIKNIMVVE